MTRKRKTDAAICESSTILDKTYDLSNYGYQPQSSEASCEKTKTSWRGQKIRRSGGRGGGRMDHQRQNLGDDSGKIHGKLGDDERLDGQERGCGESKGKDNEAYPVELVAYLKNIEQMIIIDGQIDDMVLDKCAEECSGEEEKLLSYRDSSVVVEKVFGSSRHGSELFLSRLARLKHKRLLDLFFLGTSSRTIETLFYALIPIEGVKSLELLQKFTDLLCDNWNDAVESQHSAFLLRCFTRVACGLRRKKDTLSTTQKDSSVLQPLSDTSADIEVGLSRVFDHIASLALGCVTSPRLENVHLSLVVQDVIEADRLAKQGKSVALVEKTLTTTSGKNLRQLWCGKNSSRVWEKLVMNCGEQNLQSLWDTLLVGHVEELAAHPCANYPLQSFITSVMSLSLATHVCQESTTLIQKLLSGERWGVAEAILRCASRHPDLQEPLLKELRRFFKANKVATKNNFMFNVITQNRYNGKNFDVNQCQLHGSLVLEILLSFHKVKTITACLEALQDCDVVKLAQNRCGSHVLQAAFRSSTLNEGVKEKLIKPFEDNWESLISDVYGSHVFESIWDCSLFDVRRRQELMKKLVPIRSDSKFWKFAMLRCDMNLFRKDRKAWIAKMKESIKRRKDQHCS